MGRRKVSISGENSVVLAVRVPKSWYLAFKELETEDVKQQTLLRSALKRFLQTKRAFPPERPRERGAYKKEGLEATA